MDTLKFTDIFRDCIMNTVNQLYSPQDTLHTIIIPPDHAEFVNRWAHEQFHMMAKAPSLETIVAFSKPGQKLEFRYSGIKLEIIIGAHHNHASKVYLDSCKEYQLKTT